MMRSISPAKNQSSASITGTQRMQMLLLNANGISATCLLEVMDLSCSGACNLLVKKPNQGSCEEVQLFMQSDIIQFNIMHSETINDCYRNRRARRRGTGFWVAACGHSPDDSRLRLRLPR